MAPEQAEGEPCDARTDIYSLGLVLQEMFIGRRVSQSHGSARAIPRGLDRVVRKCLEQDPTQRWQTAGELRDELERSTVWTHGWKKAGLTLSIGVVLAGGFWMSHSRSSTVALQKPIYVFHGHVQDESGGPVAEAAVSGNDVSVTSKQDGTFSLSFASDPGYTIRLTINRPGYRTRRIDADFRVPDFGVVLERER